MGATNAWKEHPVATEIDRMPGVAGRTSPRDYPWDEWLRVGSKWQLVRGVDYRVATRAFRSYCYDAAAARGVKVATVTSPCSQQLSIRAYTPGRCGGDGRCGGCGGCEGG
jgi:hypothetical protein